MKKTLFIFSFLLSVVGHSQAEVYATNFSAPSNTPGRMWNYGFEVDLSHAENGEVVGEVKRFFGADRCRWPGTKIKGTLKPTREIQWQTEQNPLQGCGTIRFVGVKEEGKLVGYLPRFQGVRVDLELTLEK